MPDWYARLVMQLAASASSSSSAGLAADADVSRALADYRLTVGGSAELRRTDDVVGGTFTVHGGLVRPDQVKAKEVSLLVTSFAHTVEISTPPSLHGPRDRLRAPYDRVASTLWIEPIHLADSLSSGICPLTVTWGSDEQLVAGVRHTREQVSAAFSAMRYCRTPIGEPPRWCLSLFDLEVHSIGGALPVTGGNLAPVSFDHVVAGAWSVDASLGYGGGTIDIPGLPPPPSDAMDDPNTDCEDEGRCVQLHAPTYDLAARSEHVDLRGHRSTYPTMTGELAIEDRAEATLRWPVGYTTLAGHGFAAFTRWWTLDVDRLARAGAAVTGGGDVTATREIQGWQLDLSVEVARSFYAAHDGGAPRAELGAQGTISMSRALERTW